MQRCHQPSALGAVLKVTIAPKAQQTRLRALLVCFRVVTSSLMRASTGRFGSDIGLANSSCDGMCAPGFYGSASGQVNAQCNGPCNPGMKHVHGERTRTPSRKQVVTGCPDNSRQLARVLALLVRFLLLFLCHGHATGYYCPASSSSPTAVDCPLGHYCPSGAGSANPCPAGRSVSASVCAVRSLLLIVPQIRFREELANFSVQRIVRPTFLLSSGQHYSDGGKLRSRSS